MSNSAKRKVNYIIIPKTELQMSRTIYLQIFTHNFALSGSSCLLSWYALPLLRLRLCLTVQLGISLWPWELNKLPWSSSLLFITDLNTASLVERSLTAAISYISSASVMLECWQNLSKLTNQRVYQILVYRNELLFNKFSHRRSLASFCCAFLYFFRALFSALRPD